MGVTILEVFVVGIDDDLLCVYKAFLFIFFILFNYWLFYWIDEEIEVRGFEEFVSFT